MNNVIQLIEKIGQTGEFTAENYRREVEQADISDELKAALIERDMPALESMLGANHSLMCLVVPADDDDGDDDGDSTQEEIAV